MTDLTASGPVQITITVTPQRASPAQEGLDTMANRTKDRIHLDKQVAEMPGVSKTVKHIYGVRKHLDLVAVDIRTRQMEHDLSKLEEPELSGFSKYGDMPEHGTPAYEARLEEMHPILVAHYRANDHHPEHYLLDGNPTPPTRKGIEAASKQGLGINLMPMPAQIEMLCDWKDRAGDTFWDSWDYNMRRFGIGPQLEMVLKATAEYYGF